MFAAIWRIVRPTKLLRKRRSNWLSKSTQVSSNAAATTEATAKNSGVDGRQVQSSGVSMLYGRKALIIGIAAGMLLLLAAICLAYSPVFFNFFSGDDFVHLTWLTQAVKNPELIWRNFHSSWLDGTTTQFYRPLISVFMVTDYLVWGVNGLGFRLTNLTFHFLSSVFLFAIIADIGFRAFEPASAGTNRAPVKLDGAAEKSLKINLPTLSWALAASFLFALYPLHPEAVSWITGRVDAIVTTFILASLWSFLRWRAACRATSPTAWIWFASTSVFMILGLLSKEMAITLPAVFFCWEFIFGNGAGKVAGKESSSNNLVRGNQAGGLLAAPTGTDKPIPLLLNRVLESLVATSFFWLLLGGYFIVRRMALGTFVGGYDDSLLFIANWRAFLGSWVHGLRMFMVPINKDFLGSHDLLTKLWEAAVGLSVVLAIGSIMRDRRLLKPAAFITAWLALCLLPVYKIFTIADDLQGSRLAYLATAPLCVLLVMAVAGSSIERRGLRLIRFASALVLIVLSAILLWINNQAWWHAGQESNHIRAGLSRLYQDLPGDPQVLLLGLPDHIEGAYVCRNALWGMLKKPQLQRDILNCLMVDRFEPILPFGFLKQSLGQSKDAVKIFKWDSSLKRFTQVILPNDDVLHKSWNSQTLRQVISKDPESGAVANWQEGGLEVIGGTGPRGRPALRLSLDGLPCWAIDFVGIKIKVIGHQGRGSAVGADLLYTNDLVPNFELTSRSHLQLKPVLQDQLLIFPLHALPEWALGGSCHGMKLLLPENCHLQIEGVEIIPTDKLLARIQFGNSGFLGTKGFIHLSKTAPSQTVSFTSDKIPGAKKVLLEISRANLFFENQNSSEFSKIGMRYLEQPVSSGTINLKRDMFPSAGIYEMRPWVLDSQGQPTGLAGDHIVIAVDS